MSRVFVPAAFAFLAAATQPAALPANAAQPGDAVLMADFFTGTLEIDVPAGDWSAKTYLSPDHTFRETGSDGEVHGVWEVRDGKLCTTVDHALGPDRLKTYCNVGAGKHAGDMWKDADPVTGNTVLFKLSAGALTLRAAGRPRRSRRGRSSRRAGRRRRRGSRSGPRPPVPASRRSAARRPG